VKCWKAGHSELLLLGAKILVQVEKEKIEGSGGNRKRFLNYGIFFVRLTKLLVIY